MIGKKTDYWDEHPQDLLGKISTEQSSQDPRYLPWKQSGSYSFTEPSSASFWVSVGFCNQLPELIDVFKPPCVITVTKEVTALVLAGSLFMPS